MTAQPETPQTPTFRFTTREAWLHAAVDMFRDTFNRILNADPEFALAVGIPDDLLVGVGFPYGTGPESAGVRAVTYIRGVSESGVPNVFMCPTYDDAFTVLKVLLHELVHVADDCESGHRDFFAQVAKALGLKSPYTTATPDEFLTLELQSMLDVLGPYPHHAMDIQILTGAKLPYGVKAPVGPDGEPGPPEPGDSVTLVAGKRRRVTSAGPRQTSRWFKFMCANPDCALDGKFSGRFTRSVVELAVPICPCCRTELSAC